MIGAIDPGKMDRQIIIQQQNVSQSLGGQAKAAPTTFATVWAEYLPMTASERFRSEGEHSSIVARFRIWHLPNLNPTMLISFDSLSWRILGIAEIGRKDGHEITAEALQ